VFRLIPRRLRDVLYDYIARKRFDWYGRRDACRVPTAAEQERFCPEQEHNSCPEDRYE
jgi:predicted DCC family thiol-disulfide oxidoreductase YuxK